MSVTASMLPGKRISQGEPEYFTISVAASALPGKPSGEPALALTGDGNTVAGKFIAKVPLASLTSKPTCVGVNAPRRWTQTVYSVLGDKSVAHNANPVSVGWMIAAGV